MARHVGGLIDLQTMIKVFPNLPIVIFTDNDAHKYFEYKYTANKIQEVSVSDVYEYDGMYTDDIEALYEHWSYVWFHSTNALPEEIELKWKEFKSKLEPKQCICAYVKPLMN